MDLRWMMNDKQSELKKISSTHDFEINPSYYIEVPWLGIKLIKKTDEVAELALIEDKKLEHKLKMFNESTVETYLEWLGNQKNKLQKTVEDIGKDFEEMKQLLDRIDLLIYNLMNTFISTRKTQSKNFNNHIENLIEASKEVIAIFQGQNNTCKIPAAAVLSTTVPDDVLELVTSTLKNGVSSDNIS